MRLMKIGTILPLLTETPVVLLTACQVILPMWVSRLLVAPYFIPMCAIPWLTISMLRPFRRRFVKLISKLKMTAPQEIELRAPRLIRRRTTTVQEMH
jgi:hypothetical protein